MLRQWAVEKPVKQCHQARWHGTECVAVEIGGKGVIHES